MCVCVVYMYRIININTMMCIIIPILHLEIFDGSYNFASTGFVKLDFFITYMYMYT